MRGRTPTLHCDGEDCDSWSVDYWEQTASTVDGVRVTTGARAPGWTNTSDEDLCPDCTQALARYEETAPGPIVGGPIFLHDADNPYVEGGLYVIGYSEKVNGYWHAYRDDTRRRVRYSRTANHPEDPRCPGCADMARGGR